jgi:hypothetical protein
MKKVFTLIAAISIAIANVNAQTSTVSVKHNSAFEAAMLTNIKQLDTASGAASLMALANNFERIGNAEKTKWEPFYYASYCYTVMAFMSSDKSKIDWLADKAEALLQQAEAIDKNNSEISCMFATINSCRIMVDPMSRFPTKGQEVNAMLAKATQENAGNPRIYLLQARMQLRTPEAFGGGKTVAKTSAETALEKFKSFVPASAIAPTWGEQQAKALLAKINGE